MTRAVRRRLAVAAFVASATALTGCGSDVLSADLHPGAAAVAGDYEITMEELDEMSDDLCRLIEPQLEANGDVLPMARIRAIALTNLLIEGELSRRFADDQDVEVSDELEAGLRAIPEQLEAQGYEGRDLELAVEFSERGQFHQFVVTEVARRELGDQTTTSTLVERGEEIFVEWLKTQDYEVDPRIGSLNPLEGGIFEKGDPGLSVPVSDQAVEAAAREDDIEVHEAYVESLPDSQRCGEVPEEAPVAPNPLAP